MKRLSGKIGVFLLAVMMSFLAACGNADINDAAQSSEENTENTESSKEEISGALFEETDKDVTVRLYTDKPSYKAGEDVNYVLEIFNNNEDYTVSGKKFKYSNKGLLPKEEGSMPDLFDNIKSGESVKLEGTLVGGNAGYPGTMGGGETGDGVDFKPIVEFDYGGETVFIRCILNLKLVMVVQQFGDKAKNPETACCHDPSIFKDTDGTYYIFGTHISCSSSTDLFNWTDRGEEFKAALSEETIEKIRSWNLEKEGGDWWGYLWAPDIIYNKAMGKYCIYLSADGELWKSNIVLLTADSVLGPYEYEGSLVYSGFDKDNYTETDLVKALGESELPERYLTHGVANKKWGDIFPNCIDPCVFYDEEGKLWMSYGSWSGGIFMFELDEETGLRDYSVKYETEKHSDAYFGKLIAGGRYVTGEGSYIKHIGDYYYLFLSYGGLEAKQGYNIRVFRSKEPDGPYVDALGHEPYYDSYSLNTNQPVGVRIFGAYRWRMMNYGQLSQGHNSAFVDDDGRAYIIFHTRTDAGDERHFVKVHQLFMNEDGWPVAAPFITDGEKLDEKGLSAEDIAGDCEIIVHNLNLKYDKFELGPIEKITLTPEGSITGAYEGSWEAVAGTPYVRLSFNKDVYSGVALKMNIEGSSIETTVFTALGKESQITVWGYKK